MEEARLFSRGFVLANLANLTFFTGVTTFFVLPVYMETLGASRADVGHVMGSFGLTSIFAIPLTGTLIDRFGRRPFMITGAALWGLTSLVFSTVDHFGPLLFVLRMAQGIAFAFAFVATNAMIADLAPPRALGRAISIFGTTTLVTHAVGPVVGEAMLHTLGFRALCLASVASACAAIVVYLAISEPTRLAPSPESRAGAGLLALTKRRGARSALVGGTASAIAFGATTNFMPIFVHSRGIASFSPFFTGYVIAAILVRLTGGGLGDRLGHRLVAAWALSALALIVGGFAAVHGVPLLVALALSFGVAHGWTYPALNALFLEGTPASARGRAMSLYNLSFNAGVTVATFAGGEIAERLGYSAMWLVMAALPFLGVVALVVDRPKAERAARE